MPLGKSHQAPSSSPTLFHCIVYLMHSEVDMNRHKLGNSHDSRLDRLIARSGMLYICRGRRSPKRNRSVQSIEFPYSGIEIIALMPALYGVYAGREIRPGAGNNHIESNQSGI